MCTDSRSQICPWTIQFFLNELKRPPLFQDVNEDHHATRIAKRSGEPTKASTLTWCSNKRRLEAVVTSQQVFIHSRLSFSSFIYLISALRRCMDSFSMPTSAHLDVVSIASYVQILLIRRCIGDGSEYSMIKTSSHERAPLNVSAWAASSQHMPNHSCKLFLFLTNHGLRHCPTTIMRNAGSSVKTKSRMAKECILLLLAVLTQVNGFAKINPALRRLVFKAKNGIDLDDAIVSLRLALALSEPRFNYQPSIVTKRKMQKKLVNFFTFLDWLPWLFQVWFFFFRMSKPNQF